jgi:hypothetical protein
VGRSGAGAPGAPPHAQVGEAQAADAAKGSVTAVPNTAAPNMRGRERARATTKSVSSP